MAYTVDASNFSISRDVVGCVYVSVSTSPEIQELSGIFGVFKDNFEN